jgi:transcriptional regulator with XRE-family HTH domain
MPKTDVHAHFIRRLKQARNALGLSQTALGVRMGLTDDIASTRINRYEVGTSEPDLRTAERMAKELGVSLSWLVCTDPKLAAVIDGFTKLDAKRQDAFVARLQAELRKPVAKKLASKVSVGARSAATKKVASKKPPVKKVAKKKVAKRLPRRAAPP